MNLINKNNKKGFTIIEVVLVLAIAGLIFLMVFLALPALQRSQRDTQRKNDASRLRAAVTDYTSNNRGALPWTAAGAIAKDSAFLTNYVLKGSSFNDPSTNDQYTVEAKDTKSRVSMGDAAIGTMYVAAKAACDNDGAIKSGNSIVVSVKTESGVANCVEG
jgi:hypothetical protein cdiviTM7_02704